MVSIWNCAISCSMASGLGAQQTVLPEWRISQVRLKPNELDTVGTIRTDCRVASAVKRKATFSSRPRRLCTFFGGGGVVQEIKKGVGTPRTGRRRKGGLVAVGEGAGSQELSTRLLRPPLATKPSTS